MTSPRLWRQEMAALPGDTKALIAPE